MLKNLFTSANHLETLPSNLFETNLEITHVMFAYEKLKFVGENILSPLKKLKWAYFAENPCISKWANNEAELPALIAELQKTCKPPQETTPEPQEDPSNSTQKAVQ
jgi:hypothetical protein